MNPKMRILTIVCGVVLAVASMPALSDACIFGWLRPPAAPVVVARGVRELVRRRAGVVRPRAGVACRRRANTCRRSSTVHCTSRRS